ncbi:type II secretion system GspH family protein [Luteolibacter arcticus]|uniref:Type II secretion system GspH family protein n=1 Tax=Luteolibacter arcticus TaxID=1581411 RepID=A0ABT3GG08_9BACT|nr:type II secretion system GspH family protein [Luteolibacter arcticus]MCW1922555.1 type II secretion system GspH family protein [Luteolibacter arcticus]
MKTRPYRRSQRGFTLVELLVVVSIIIVLAAMSFGAISIATKKKNAVTTLTDVTALASALDRYYDEYNKLPNVGSQDEMVAEGQSGAELLTILLGKEESSGEMQNPRQIVFLTSRNTKNKKQGGLVYSNGNQVEGLYDAWGRPLNIKFDEDFDGEIQNPIKQGDIVRGKKVIIWSFGADGKFGDNDEVKSW